MRAENSSINSSIKTNDYSLGGRDGSNLLNQLEQRVNETLKFGGAGLEIKGGGNDALSPETVRNLISDISGVSLPGMSQNFVV